LKSFPKALRKKQKHLRRKPYILMKTKWFKKKRGTAKQYPFCMERDEIGNNALGTRGNMIK